MNWLIPTAHPVIGTGGRIPLNDAQTTKEKQWQDVKRIREALHRNKRAISRMAVLEVMLVGGSYSAHEVAEKAGRGVDYTRRILQSLETEGLVTCQRRETTCIGATPSIWRIKGHGCTCPWCGNGLPPNKTSPHTYCSANCRVRFNNLRK